MTVNAWRIDTGMFKGNFGQILNKFTWGGLNSLVGNIVAHGLNIFGAIDRVTEMEGMLALSGVTKGNSAFTIGHLSFGPDNYTADWRDHLFVHEYGHYIQSQRFGPFYLKVVGVSSLLSAAFTSSWGGTIHLKRWFEVNASKLGAKYFEKRYGGTDEERRKNPSQYFDINAFRLGGFSHYTNPRLKEQSQDGRYPTSGENIIFWDFIL